MWRENSTKLKLVCFSSFLIVMASCSKDDDEDKILGKNYIHYISGSVCTEATVPLPPTADQLEDSGAEGGLCPDTLPVLMETATLVRTCNPVTTTDNGISNTTVSKIYSKTDNGDGTTTEISTATAASLCTQIETRAE
ncbi:MAG: hypothetical protein EOP10_26920 [Proteobacteria bacterium]|nr:MAG: hypothetical protein EOP10_26920 [Pseudomonadota bacterium]